MHARADAEEKDKGKKKLKPPRVVKQEAAKGMLSDTAKRAKAETALHLLHAVVAGNNGAHIGLAAADVSGIQVCTPTTDAILDPLLLTFIYYIYIGHCCRFARVP